VRRMLGTGLAVLVGAFGATAISAMASNGGAGSSSKTTKLWVVEHATTDTEFPTGGGATGSDKFGDILAFGNPVFNRADTKMVGVDQGQCIRIRPVANALGRSNWECWWTTLLARGQITVEGPFYDTHDSMLSITGGTGAYNGVKGQMLLHSKMVHGQQEYDFVFSMKS
jgi:allene oxide cyclase